MLLVQHRAVGDPETGGSYTVELDERVSPEVVELRPDTDAEGFAPIVVTAADDEVRVLAELVEVLRG